MAILAFQKPDKVIMTTSNEIEGEFEFKPLEPGYGITIGNALRRILLSSLEGYAISSVKIQGVDHEFSTIKGVMEDLTEIVLNLKQVRFKKQIEGTNTEKVTISIADREVLTAGDLGKFTSAFQVLNPDLIICRMESNVKLKMDITIVKGRGYVPAEENKPLNAEIGMIPIDSIFTPIKNVKYTVENFRVEQKTDYEKLLLTVTTDGSIHPKEALKEAAKILIYHFALFSDEKITIDLDSKSQSEELDENDLRIRQLLKTKLVDMDLSVRALNCLKAAEVATLGELVKFNKNDLLKF
ncbi:MAG TPA: DNA-directed RNA polymerase subunit alpha, partial [Bacteroidia bacterium]|nr:DNA-directed RNA polymerase subunit alpha [Bacteroidia bacterium]